MLGEVKNAENEAHTLDYFAGGLLKTFKDPLGHDAHFTYDAATGRLKTDEDKSGSVVALTREQTATGYRIKRTSDMDKVTLFEAEQLPGGGSRSTTMDPSGAKPSWSTAPTASRGSRSPTAPWSRRRSPATRAGACARRRRRGRPSRRPPGAEGRDPRAQRRAQAARRPVQRQDAHGRDDRQRQDDAARVHGATRKLRARRPRAAGSRRPTTRRAARYAHGYGPGVAPRR